MRHNLLVLLVLAVGVQAIAFPPALARSNTRLSTTVEVEDVEGAPGDLVLLEAHVQSTSDRGVRGRVEFRIGQKRVGRASIYGGFARLRVTIPEEWESGKKLLQARYLGTNIFKSSKGTAELTILGEDKEEEDEEDDEESPPQSGTGKTTGSPSQQTPGPAAIALPVRSGTPQGVTAQNTRQARPPMKFGVPPQNKKVIRRPLP